jgi:hypothetical protein
MPDYIIEGRMWVTMKVYAESEQEAREVYERCDYENCIDAEDFSYIDIDSVTEE